MVTCYHNVMFIQETCETLAAQGSTDDELISKHLRTLAEMSVRSCIVKIRRQITSLYFIRGKKERLAAKSWIMASYPLALVTYRTKKH